MKKKIIGALCLLALASTAGYWFAGGPQKEYFPATVSKNGKPLPVYQIEADVPARMNPDHTVVAERIPDNVRRMLEAARPSSATASTVVQGN